MNTKPSDETFTTAKHLCFARVASGNSSRYQVNLQILQPDGCDEGAYFPAQSIDLPNIDGVRALHSICSELIAHHEKCEELHKNNS